MGDSIKVTVNGEEKEVYLKDDFDAVNQKLGTTQKELEDTRMEVLTPEYSAYLDSLEKGGGDKGEKKETEKKKESAEGEEDEFKNLTPKQIYERAKKDALSEVETRLNKKDEERKRESELQTKQEIASFAKEHDDYETFRPVMYGLSTDPKNKNATLSQLYDMAKKHVENIKTGKSTEKEKERQGKTRSEKPGGNAESYEQLKKMSSEQIAQKSLDEVKESLGPIPSA